MKYILSFLLLLCFFQVITIIALDGAQSLHIINRANVQHEFLRVDYYSRTCPQLENIIHNKVAAWIKKDFSMAASLIRLHFHDCAVRGCDGSILLNHGKSERASLASKSLRGFEVIDEIKADLEKRCPRVVSCADILTVVARDATLQIGGPFWEVPFGRKDGKISRTREAHAVPMGRENITQLLEFSESRGLSLVDLVVLSGVHTIGRSTCEVIQHRLYNFNGTRKPDPSLNTMYLNYLRAKCTKKTDLVNLDASTPNTFDVNYYKNLHKKMGLLSTDQLLISDPRTADIVSAFASQPWLFLQQFSVSMIKLGNTQVLTGRLQGEIRHNCNFVNK